MKRSHRAGVPMVASVCAAGFLCVAGAVSSQQTPASDPLESGALDEVIVTARKQPESILKVPVIETVISGIQLDRMQVTELSDLPKLVPGLNLGKNDFANGTDVALRGIGTASNDPGVDSSVALNIDGMAIGNGLAMQSGLFDLGQIEVLKGPQALFYGKGSPGGVIALRTADPTDKLEVMARAAYEFESISPLEELVLSGPVTDSLKLRLAGQYSTARGYFYNEATADTTTGALPPAYSRASHSQNYKIRGTALWDPSEQLSARVKVNLVGDYGNDADEAQLASCPSGTSSYVGIPFLDPKENCQLDRVMRSVGLNPVDFPGIWNHGVPYLADYQKYGTVELNYRPRQDLTVSSTTGYYHLAMDAQQNAASSGFAAPPFGVNVGFGRRDFTEELRATSNFSTPVNFMVGGFYQNGAFFQHTDTIGNLAEGLPPALQNGEDDVSIKTWSAFGQARWKIVTQLELAAGLRWTDETREQHAYDYLAQAAVPLVTPRIHSDKSSPEVSLTYTPTDDLTFFGDYKQGFKSGSFSVGTPPLPGVDNSFGDETVKGGELGMKSRLLDRQLALNIAGYLYNYNGLQVGSVNPNHPGGISIVSTVNAGAARSYGIDADAAYRPAAMKGLGLHGALNWNHARYLVLNNVPCWGGQTIAAGCNQSLNATTGLFTAQNLSGTPLLRAPSWDVNLGVDYEIRLTGDYKLILSNGNHLSSRYVTVLMTGRPTDDNYQGSFIKSDVGLTLQSPDSKWEVAVIAKDINDRITTGNCASGNLANGAIFGGQITGGTGAGPGGIDALTCFVDPGRQVWLRATIRPFQ